MSGCSIEDAFPGSMGDTARVARREERRRAKMCKGPALSFLKGGGEGSANSQNLAFSEGTSQQEAFDQDPDRQQYIKSKPIDAMERKEEAFVSGQLSDQKASNDVWVPRSKSLCDQAEEDAVKNLVGQQVDDIIGQKQRETLPKNIEGTSQLPDPRKSTFGSKVASYFGRGIDDGFADFSKSVNDNPGYQLTSQGADFLGSFGAVGLGKSAGVPTLATPSVNDAWKPLTPGGARSSYFDLLPPPGGQVRGGNGDAGVFSRDEKEALLKKLDFLFAKLDDIESKKNEYAHVEISLFVLSGLFLMYGLDLARRL
jgi:hypothetical protein